MERRYVFLGGGNMTQAMLKGFATQGKTDRYIVVERDEKTREALTQQFGVATKASLQGATEPFFVILAIKPQDAKVFLPTLTLPAGSVLCSIAAGLGIATIEKLIPVQTIIVRAMPNLAAAVGHAVTGLFAPEDTPQDARQETEALFATFGKVFWLKDENMLHAVTALTGSGPGYVFHIMDIMAKTAQKMGFTVEESRDMIQELFLGAAMMAENDDFAALAKAVSSKGGTTEAALRFLEEKELTAILQEAIFRAHERSLALASSF
jgi:pyrroline-5-carboxylate reductase